MTALEFQQIKNRCATDEINDHAHRDMQALIDHIEMNDVLGRVQRQQDGLGVTPERTEQIAQRLEDASKGPWKLGETTFWRTEILDEHGREVGGFFHIEDAKLAICMREDLRDLLAQVARQQKVALAHTARYEEIRDSVYNAALRFSDTADAIREKGLHEQVQQILAEHAYYKAAFQLLAFCRVTDERCDVHPNARLIVSPDVTLKACPLCRLDDIEFSEHFE